MSNTQVQKFLPFVVFGITVILGVISLISAITMQRLPLEMFPAGPYESPAPPGEASPPPPGEGGNCTPADDCSGCSGVPEWADCQCAAGNYDPWRCSGDDDDDDDDTSPSPSPRPSPSPSPSPQVGYRCVSLNQSATPVPGGDPVTYTCRGAATNITLTRARFRVRYRPDSATAYTTLGSVAEVGVTNNQAAWGFSLPETADPGEYLIQCRVCPQTGACTAWGRANP